MKKLLKIVGGIILGIVVLALLLVLTLPLWLGPVVKPIANAAVPKMTKTSFNLGHLSLNPYTGRFELGAMNLGNPAGYDEPTAVSVDNIVVDVAMTTLPSECIHIEEITVDGVFVSLVKGGENNVDNMTQIQYNIAGGKDKYEAKKAKAEAEKEKAEKSAEEKPEAAEDEEPGKKVVIDVLTLSNIKVKYGMLTIPVPSITLKDLGKESDGLSFGELCETIWEAIINAALAVGDGAKALGGLLKDGASALGDGVGTAANAIGDGATKTASVIGDGAGKTVEAVGDGVKAVGDGVGAAAGAIKGLFK